MNFDDILFKLGIGSKETVYLSVTPGVGLELIHLDYATTSVKSYSNRPIKYNETLREIEDFEMFQNALAELFQELHINPNCNVILNFPTAIFGSTELPIALSDEAVTEAITSEVEQSYIFKRHEPIVSWSESLVGPPKESRKLFYTAIQKNQVEKIQAALAELGATLAGVETSLTSILKGLSFGGLAEDQMKEEVSWNLILITTSGYSIISMLGKHIVDYYEEPLAIKSFEGEEIYDAINASAQLSLINFPANYLYVISETDSVSAEALSSRIRTDSAVKFLDNNSFKKQELIPADLNILQDDILKTSLEAIGIAATPHTSMPNKFNFMRGSDGVGDENELVEITIGNRTFEISPAALKNIALIASVVILLPGLISLAVIPMATSASRTELSEINSNVEQLENQIQSMQNQESQMGNFDVNSEIKKVLGYNRSKLMAYTAIGEDIPKKLVISYFVTKDDGKIDIKGYCTNVEDIYRFYRNLKDSLIDTKLRLQKLQMAGGSIDQIVEADPNMPTSYEFEITNMTDAELNPATAQEEKNKEGQAQQPGQNQQPGMPGAPINPGGAPLLKLGKENPNAKLEAMP